MKAKGPVPRTGTTLNNLVAYVTRYTNGIGPSVASVSMNGPFNDATCRTLAFGGGGHELASNDSLIVQASVAYASAGAPFGLGVVTAELVPTATDGPLAARGEQPEVRGSAAAGFSR